MNSAWSFEQRALRGKKRDPMEAQFFTGDEDDDDIYGRTDALVREALQNSLDARPRDVTGKVSSAPVRVRFTIGSVPLGTERARAYLDGLLPHLEALRNETVSRASVPPMNYLVFEDFGTRGLCGDPARRSDPAPETLKTDPQDFYWFWWNVGRSGKSGTDRGRWGVGKTVFPACSKINSMFALTCQYGTGRRLLMGQTVMKIHHVNGVEFNPDGCYCDPARGDRTDPNWVEMPFEDPEVLERFEKDFGLTRGSAPGTSIVVPYHFERLAAKPLLQSIIVHYFVPILRGELVAEVEGPGVSLTRLDAETITPVAAGLKWEGKRAEKKHDAPPFKLAAWAVARQRQADVPVLKLHKDAPTWTEQLFADEQLEKLRQQYATRQSIALTVPMTLEYSDKYAKELGGASGAPVRTAQTSFDVFIERDDLAERGEDYFVRGGMTISGISTISGARGVRALVLVDQRELSTLLGDAEGPAHTDWKEGEDALRKHYSKYPSRIRFVRNAVAKLLSILSPAPQGMNRDILRDLFFVDIKDDGPGDDQSGQPPPVGPIPTVPPTPFNSTRLEGGFRVFGRSVEGRTRPQRIRVEAAFEVDGFSPARALKSYSRFDFRFDELGDELSISPQGCAVAACILNTFEILPDRDDFEVVVRGFPKHLDVVVRLSDVSRESEADLEEEGAP